jgi:hypothetical protein
VDFAAKGIDWVITTRITYTGIYLAYHNFRGNAFGDNLRRFSSIIPLHRKATYYLVSANFVLPNYNDHDLIFFCIIVNRLFFLFKLQ